MSCKDITFFYYLIALMYYFLFFMTHFMLFIRHTCNYNNFPVKNRDATVK